MEYGGKPVSELLRIRRRLFQSRRQVDVLPALDLRMDTANPGYVRRLSERNRIPRLRWYPLVLEYTDKFQLGGAALSLR
nr:hypothetical protein [uncultured Oscillibacter sp.]